MDAYRDHTVRGPEEIIQEAIENMLRIRGWYVMRMMGNAYQSGVPDDFACHKLYRQRWIEVKLPNMRGSKFTKRQLEVFPELCKHGSGVWILTAATETEYQKLFQPPNWHKYCSAYGGIF